MGGLCTQAFPTPDSPPTLLPPQAAALGTVGYMSPEAMQGGEVTERTDAFSYGVLLWEASQGRRWLGGTGAKG